MGVSRSGSTTISYLMKEYSLSLSEATSHVQGQRSCVKPNSGFMQQLRFYEKTLGELGGDSVTLNHVLNSTDTSQLDDS